MKLNSFITKKATIGILLKLLISMFLFSSFSSGQNLVKVAGETSDFVYSFDKPKENSEIGKLESNVGLSSGNFEMAIPLFSLPQRGPLLEDFTMSLSYSSNISSSISEMNQFSQAPWVGVGWSLGVRAIIIENNGTKDCADNEYYYFDGYSTTKIIQTHSEIADYTLENNPYFKFTFACSNGVTAVTAINEDGIIYKFGNLTGSSSERKVLCWGDRVGNGYGANGININNRLDLESISDITGNNIIKFYYEQENSSLHGYNYTRASYPDYIIDSYGRKIDFVLGTRESDEYKENSLSTFQTYETKYLEKIDLYETETALQPYLTVDLVYPAASSFFGTGKLLKRKLSELKFIAPNTNEKSTIFNYILTGDNIGALNQITYPTGGIKTISYDKVIDSGQSQLTTLFNRERVRINANEFEVKNSGSTIAALDRSESKIYLKKWVGEWLDDEISIYASGLWYPKFEVSENHMAYYIPTTSNPDNSQLVVYSWDDERKEWHLSLNESIPKNGGSGDAQLALSNTVVALMRSEVNDRIVSWQWQRNEWERLSDINSTGELSFHPWAIFQLTNNALLYSNGIYLHYFYLANNNWELKLWKDEYSPNPYPYTYKFEMGGHITSATIQDDYFSFLNQGLPYGYPNLFVFEIKNETVKCYELKDDGIAQNQKIFALYSKNHIMYRKYASSGVGKLNIINRNVDGSWPLDQDGFLIDYSQQVTLPGEKYDIQMSDEFIVGVTQNDANVHSVQTFHWNTSTLNWDQFGLNGFPTQAYDIDLVLSGNHIIAKFLETNNLSIYVWEWNGTGWNTPMVHTDSETEMHLVSEREGYYSPRLLVGSNFLGTYDFYNGAIRCWTVQGNSQWNNVITRYSVSTVTESDGSDNYITDYVYESPIYSPSYNSTSYSGVNVTPPGNQGNLKYIFHNSKSDQPRLSGRILEKKVYQQGDPNPVEIISNIWDIFTYGENDNPPTPDDIHNAYSIRLINESKIRDGVSSNSTYDYLDPNFYDHNNDVNGKPKKITETNSNGIIRTTNIRYAYSVYETMYELKYMLSQEAQRTVYDGSISSANARTSSVTTWKNWGNDVWLPDRKYSWKYSGANYNLPAFNDWNDEGIPVSPELVLTSKATSRDIYGNMNGFHDGNDISIATIWGYNSTAPVAKIINSKIGECGFTGIESGWGNWESGGSSVSDNYSHTGLSSSYSSNNYGPTKNYYCSEGIDRNKTYIFEAWIFRINGTATIAVQLRNNANQDILSKSDTKSSGSGWQHISLEITPQDMTNLPPDGHLRVWCGFIGVDNAGYIDDVRFSPMDAQMVTGTYNSSNLLITSISDANGNPTHYEYDGFGRSTNTYGPNKEFLTSKSYPDFRTTNSILYQAPNPDGFRQNLTDALGRSKEQKIQYEGGFILTSQSYDNAGRLLYDYLPNGQAKEYKYYSDPLARVDQQGMYNLSPWKINIPGEHPLKYEYGSNDGSEGYASNTLFKTSLRDENNKVSFEYKDAFDNVIQKVVNAVSTQTDPTAENLKIKFEYDVLGNLVKSTPPNGPAYASNFTYNTLSQLTQKTSPDAEPVEYIYDETGSLRFIKDGNLVQKGRFIYNKYDAFSRLIESGEYTLSGSFTQSNADNNNFPTASDGNKILTQQLYYNDIYDGYAQNNLKGKLSKSISFSQGTVICTTYYSYNEYGRVEWIQQEMPGLSDKKISYWYDRQGNVIKKCVTDLTSSTLYTFYYYNMAGRLKEVYTNTIDSETDKVKEAEYTYDTDGTIKRLQLANAQGMDYFYNERSWLTQINHQNLNSTDDPGHDGTNGVAVDKFAEVIGYNIQDHIGSGSGFNWQPQYDGNISWAIMRTKDVGLQGVSAGYPDPIIGYVYNYDGANRLTKADFGYYLSSGWSNSSPKAAMYDLPLIEYDANGNIEYLKRNSVDAVLMDDFDYTYQGTNRLTSIAGRGSYTYDNNGNITTDTYNGISLIQYNTENLPEYLVKNDETINYWYDANGNRIRKQTEDVDEIYVYGADGQTEAVFDTNGDLKFFNINAGTENIGRLEAAAYELRLKNTTLSGTKTYTGNTIIVDTGVTVTGSITLKAGMSITFKPGFHAVQGCSLIAKIDASLVVAPNRFYYLKDHLGSTRVTVDAEGEIASYDDYDPWGMVLNGRSGNDGFANDKYKFTGKERDTETNYDYFGARYYDNRIGRWLGVDPLAYDYPEWTPYNFVLNNPVNNLDPNGKNVFMFTRFYSDYIHSKYLVEITASDPLTNWEPRNGFEVVSDFGQLVNSGIMLEEPLFRLKYEDGQWYRQQTRYLENLTIGVVQIPMMGGLGGGLRGASKGLQALFTEGKVMKSASKIEQILSSNGFTQRIADNGRGFVFNNTHGEEVRIMVKNGQKYLRIKNYGNTYLDEFGNGNRSKQNTHIPISD